MTDFASFLQSQIDNVAIEPIPLDQPVSIDDLPTPALVIDLDVFDANLKKMQEHLKQHNMGLRCHGKMHKCPQVAKRQLELGAIGICCAKVSEAEIMAKAGIQNILITSPVVTRDKINRVINVAKKAEGLQIVVDNEAAATLLNQAAVDSGLTVGVLIDLDPALGRTGIEPGEPALALAKHITGSLTGLRFDGLQMYAGNCMHIEDYQERKETYTKLLKTGLDTKHLLEENGIPVKVFTGGGTGTYDIDTELGWLTDLQAGSYAFMDVGYRDIAGKSTERFTDFGPSLFVLTTAISQPQSRMITVDAGIKALATDSGYPELKDVEGVKYYFGGDEHGMIRLNNPSRTLELGDRLLVITPHCDPTVNLHDYYYPFRNGEVSELWPVSCRGKSQ